MTLQITLRPRVAEEPEHVHSMALAETGAGTWCQRCATCGEWSSPLYENVVQERVRKPRK